MPQQKLLLIYDTTPTDTDRVSATANATVAAYVIATHTLDLTLTRYTITTQIQGTDFNFTSYLNLNTYALPCIILNHHLNFSKAHKHFFPEVSFAGHLVFCRSWWVLLHRICMHVVHFIDIVPQTIPSLHMTIL